MIKLFFTLPYPSLNGIMEIVFRASEGKTVEVPYRGDVNATILDVLGGIRSACTYTGAGKLKEMPKRTTFIRVSQQLNEIFSGGKQIFKNINDK